MYYVLSFLVFLLMAHSIGPLERGPQSVVDFQAVLRWLETPAR